MVALPDEVFNALNNPKAAKIVATVRPDKNVHVVQLGSVIAPDANTIAFGAILMKETGKNMEAMKSNNQLISVLVSDGMKSYQVRAEIKTYLTSGPLFDGMNVELKKMGLQAAGVWVVEPKEVWNQSASYEAGKKMA